MLFLDLTCNYDNYFVESTLTKIIKIAKEQVKMTHVTKI